MKGVLGWMRANLLVVVLLAVIVIVIPTAWFLTSMWNTSIRERQEQAASKDWQDLQSVGRITYTIPAALPGDEPWTLDGVPNRQVTEWVRQKRQQQEAQIGQVVELALEISRRGHEPLVEGLFPAPEQDAALKTIAMAEALVGVRGEPSAYEKLLAGIKAGPPTDAGRLASALADLFAREQEKTRLLGGPDRAGADVQQELTNKLVQYRLGEYQRRASEVSVYASPDVISADRPLQLPAQPPRVDECFRWQLDYWVVQDLVRAIGAANEGPDGQPLPVDRAVVKRIDRIEVDRLLGPSATSGHTGRRGGVEETGPTLPETADPDYGHSVTGRYDNIFYDVRTATLSVIVASERLPELLNAISRTNFMTVIDLDLTGLTPQEVWSHLEQGYYYGPDHVVRADLRVETIWLRDWITPLMPEPIRVALGVPDPAKAGSEDGDD